MYKSILFVAFALPIFLPETAHAQLFNSGTNFLTSFEDLLTNTWARIIAIIGVIFVGFGWMSGRLQWHVAASVIGGIILVFGAAAIVDGLSASIT